MELLNVLALADGVYVLVKCKCGATIKHKKSIFRISCPECAYSMPVADLKELKLN